MSIYDGSRYTNVFTYTEDSVKWGGKVTAFHIRTLLRINTSNAIKHTWIEGDRLDVLSNRYYGEHQYWWFILDANPKYMEEEEINKGDVLLIPPYSELRRIIEDE